MAQIVKFSSARKTFSQVQVYKIHHGKLSRCSLLGIGSCKKTKISLIRKIEMVQHEAVRWICSNWDREASVSNMEASLCMKKIENRGSIVQLKMMQDLITREKQICKKSLPVHVVLMWDLYQFMEVESLILHLFSPCHRDVD